MNDPPSQGLIKMLTEEEMSKMEMYSPENMRKNNIIGTPESTIQRLKPAKNLATMSIATGLIAL